MPQEWSNSSCTKLVQIELRVTSQSRRLADDQTTREWPLLRSCVMWLGSASEKMKIRERKNVSNGSGLAI